MSFNKFKSTLFITGLALFPVHQAFSETAPLTSLSNEAIGQKHLTPIHMDPTLSEVNRKGQALVHKPFAVKDPSTGGGSEEKAKVVARESVLTFPNGKKVQAGPYFDELNRFEQHVNQFGYTLREKGAAVIPFIGIKLNNVEFDAKRNEVISKHDATKVKPRIPIDVAKQAHEGEVARIPDFRNLLDHHLLLPLPGGRPKPPPKTFHDSRVWSNSFGWSNKFAAFLDTSLTLDGSADRTTANGEGSAGGYVFGQQLKIVRGVANYTTPKVGNLTGDVSFYFLGYKLFSKDYNNPAAYFFSSEWSQGLDESTTIYFALGPIPMSAKLGVQGNATMDFRMGILPLHANADFVPGVNSKVYIQIGVDLVVGGAGGGSDLVLINDELAIVGRLQVLIDDKGPYFASEFAANNDMTTLAGRVYAYVFLYVPRWGIPPWERKEWDWNLFQLAGIRANGSIFSSEGKLYLF